MLFLPSFGRGLHVEPAFICEVCPDLHPHFTVRDAPSICEFVHPR